MPPIQPFSVSPQHTLMHTYIYSCFMHLKFMNLKFSFLGIEYFALLCWKIWFLVADRGLLKITEEEFSGPPMNVSTIIITIVLFLSILNSGYDLFWRVCGVLIWIWGGLLGVQVVAELLLGLVFCIWAALTVPGKFLSIQPYSEENRYGFSLCVLH